ncbi:MAG: Na+/H+ antiporter NhaA [Chloroflexota bacterium]|nr:Na+/H+ antiporter NhaA [Chloroflexota bacterium]
MTEQPPASPPVADEHGAAGDVGASSGVTFSVTNVVRHGQEAAYDTLIVDLISRISRAPGYVSHRAFRPVRGNRTYRMVVTFASEEAVHAWKESESRSEWLAAVEPLVENRTPLANISGTGQERSLALALTPLESFVSTSVSGIGLLLLGTVLALVAANSPLAAAYEHFWETTFTIGVVDGFGVTTSLRHWVNDGLMALFFFIVGLEIKREVLVGEMRSPKQAALPISAAVGGALIPALIYMAINAGGPAFSGWGIPMATDTAFSLGVVSLLGTRVRPLLLVFLTAFAIVDDILAVLVIAVFYTDQITWIWLGVAVVLLLLLGVANFAGFHGWPIFAFVGLIVWYAVYQSGVHATFAGVLVAMTVPARSWINPSEFLVRARQSIGDFEAACFMAPSILSNEPQQQATQQLEKLCEDVETPMTHLQHRLNPWVAYGILPIFAFANAGIPLLHGLGEAFTSRETWGVIAGLVIGKPLGIVLFAWLAVKIGIAIKPRAISWRHVAGVGVLGGIGFTISLFVAELAFSDRQIADAARVGILFGSIIAGVLGYFVLKVVLPPPREDAA